MQQETLVHVTWVQVKSYLIDWDKHQQWKLLRVNTILGTCSDAAITIVQLAQGTLPNQLALVLYNIMYTCI